MHHQCVSEMFYSSFRGKEVHQIYMRNDLSSIMNLQGAVRYGGERRGKQEKQNMKLRKRNREKQIYGMN